jgi:hypothetical protein
MLSSAIFFINQQMADFKSGARKFSGPKRGPSVLMAAVAKNISDMGCKPPPRTMPR